MTDQSTYERLIALLDEHNAEYRIIDHPEEGQTDRVSEMRGNNVGAAAKCIMIMVKVSRKEKVHVLAVVPGDKRVNLGKIKELYKGRYAGFLDQEIAEEVTGCVAGTILPLSFNENITLIVDPELLNNKELFFNAARLDRSLALNTDDYQRIVQPRLEPIAE